MQKRARTLRALGIGGIGASEPHAGARRAVVSVLGVGIPAGRRGDLAVAVGHDDMALARGLAGVLKDTPASRCWMPSATFTSARSPRTTRSVNSPSGVNLKTHSSPARSAYQRMSEYTQTAKTPQAVTNLDASGATGSRGRSRTIRR